MFRKINCTTLLSKTGVLIVQHFYERTKTKTTAALLFFSGSRFSLEGAEEKWMKQGFPGCGENSQKPAGNGMNGKQRSRTWSAGTRKRRIPASTRWSCIHEMVHAASLSPEQLAELIRAASAGMIPGVAALQGEAEYRSDDAGDSETEEEEKEDTEE